VAALLWAVGQYLFKTGATRATGGPVSLLLTPWVPAAMVCYLTVMALFSYAFSRGGTVTVLYPIYATTFIWAAIMGMLLYQQPIRAIHVLGMVLLVAGMYCMGVGNAAR
jgi:multidrug transporter EmrE-like cation transporter